MKAFLSVAFALLITNPNLGQAQSLGLYARGDSLTTSCRAYLQMKRNGNTAASQEAFDAGFCQGMVYAALDANAVHFYEITATEVLPRVCIPDSVNANDATEVVAQYLDTHPEKRSTAAYFLIRQALAGAWPCK